MRYKYQLNLLVLPEETAYTPITAEFVPRSYYMSHWLTPHSVIFVHGLNGDAKETWTTRKTRRRWIDDEAFLRTGLRRARIFTFGYNASAVLFSSSADIRDIAANLLEAIHCQRGTPSVNPRTSFRGTN